MAQAEVTRSGHAILAATPWDQGGRRILCHLPTNDYTPFVVWYETRDRVTVSGHYCRTGLEAFELFRRYEHSAVA